MSETLEEYAYRLSLEELVDQIVEGAELFRRARVRVLYRAYQSRRVEGEKTADWDPDYDEAVRAAAFDSA